MKRREDPVKAMKKILKLYEKKKELEKELNEFWKERDTKDLKQGLIFVGCISLFIVGIFVGLFLLFEELPQEIKILGGYLLGISSGMAILFMAEAKMEVLEDQIKEIDKEIDSVEKEIEKIKREIE